MTSGSYKEIAAEDFAAAECLISQPNHCLTYFEQGIEKLMKHIISLDRRNDELTALLYSHNLAGMCRRISKEKKELKEHYEVLTLLQDVYYTTRYPNPSYKIYTPADVAEIYDEIQLIKKILEDYITIKEKMVLSQSSEQSLTTHEFK